MVRNDTGAHAPKPLERPDPGIIEELKQEAVEDTANAVTDAALHVAAGAKTIAEELPKAYNAAVEHPVEFAEVSGRALKRYIRHNPFEAMTIFASLAFAMGGLWGLSQRERRGRVRVQRYQPGRYDMVRTFENAAEDTSRQSQQQGGYTDRAMDAARDTASDAVDRVTAVAREAMADPQRFARTTVDDVTRYTQEKPLQALGIAAGIAFIFGALWKR